MIQRTVIVLSLIVLVWTLPVSPGGWEGQGTEWTPRKTGTEDASYTEPEPEPELELELGLVTDPETELELVTDPETEQESDLEQEQELQSEATKTGEDLAVAATLYRESYAFRRRPRPYSRYPPHSLRNGPSPGLQTSSGGGTRSSPAGGGGTSLSSRQTSPWTGYVGRPSASYNSRRSYNNGWNGGRRRSPTYDYETRGTNTDYDGYVVEDIDEPVGVNMLLYATSFMI